MNLIVFLDTQNKAIHEDGHGRNVDAAVGGNNTGLGHTSGQVASQEGSFVDGKARAVQVVGCQVIDIDDAEQLIRVGSGGCGSGVTKQEADGHDQIAAFLEESVDVGFVVSLLLGFEVLGLDAEVCNCVFHAFPGSGVEGFVVNSADVGDLASQEFRREQIVIGDGEVWAKVLGINFIQETILSQFLDGGIHQRSTISLPLGKMKPRKSLDMEGPTSFRASAFSPR